MLRTEQERIKALRRDLRRAQVRSTSPGFGQGPFLDSVRATKLELDRSHVVPYQKRAARKPPLAHSARPRHHSRSVFAIQSSRRAIESRSALLARTGVLAAVIERASSSSAWSGPASRETS